MIVIEGYPELSMFCARCRKRLTSLNHMVNPVSLWGKNECVCSECVGRFIDEYLTVGYGRGQIT